MMVVVGVVVVGAIQALPDTLRSCVAPVFTRPTVLAITTTVCVFCFVLHPGLKELRLLGLPLVDPGHTIACVNPCPHFPRRRFSVWPDLNWFWLPRSAVLDLKELGELLKVCPMFFRRL